MSLPLDLVSRLGAAGLDPDSIEALEARARARLRFRR